MAETKSILKSASKNVSVVCDEALLIFATSGLIVLERGLMKSLQKQPITLLVKAMLANKMFWLKNELIR